jgi:hypothetical protein
VLENEEKTRLRAEKYIHVQAPTATQKHWHSKCHYKRNSGSTSAGTNNPTRRGGGGGLRSNRRLTDGSPSPAPAAVTTTPSTGGRTAVAMASGRTPLQPCPRPRRRSRGEDKYKGSEAQSANGGGDPVGDGDFSSRLRLGTDDRGRQPAEFRRRVSPIRGLGRWKDTMCHTRFLEGKPNANHVRARISYSRTQQLHNMDIITQCSK